MVNNERALYMPQTANTSLAFLDTMITPISAWWCVFVHATDVMDKDKKGGDDKNITAIITMQTYTSTIQAPDTSVAK